MNRFVALFAAACAAAAGVSASETTADMASAVAANWLAQNQNFVSGITTGEPIAERDASGKLLWWTVRLSSGGALMVAPDTYVEPVLAALPSYDGTLPVDHPLRSLLTLDISNRLAHATSAAAGATATAPAGIRGVAAPTVTLSSAAQAALSKWSALGGVPTALRTAYHDPITGTASPNYILGLCPGFQYGGSLTHWNQGEVNGEYTYNYHTPLHAVCGCVATAGATILQTFGVLSPVSDYEGYQGGVTWGAPMSPTMHAFDQTLLGSSSNQYDWASLPASYGGTNTSTTALTAANRELLGRVTYDVGTCVGMQYDLDGGSTESGAVMYYLAPTFREVYGFGDARGLGPESPDDTVVDTVNGKKRYWEYENGNTYYNAKFANFNEKFIYDQLRNNVPVGLGIRDFSGNSGHAVVAVGYGLDATGASYTRVFMGWGGSGDGWYCLPNINNDEYVVVDTVISFIAAPGSTNSVPFVGRVTTGETDSWGNPVGAAFQTVALLNEDGTTNQVAVTDAHGYWSLRTDSTGWTNNLANPVAVTPFPDVDDEPVPTDASELKALQTRIRNSPSATIVDAYTVYRETVWLSDDETTYSVRSTNYTYSAEAKAVCGGVSTNLVFSPLVFVAGDSTLPDMVCDSLDLTVNTTSAITAYSSPMDIEEIAAIAEAADKKLLVVNGDPEDEDVKALKAWLAANPDVVNEGYVVYSVIPDMDNQNWDDGDALTYGVFDPCNVTAEGRWSVSNGRLVYRACGDTGFDEATFVADLNKASRAYALRHHAGNLSVSAYAYLVADEATTNDVLTADKTYFWGEPQGPVATNIAGTVLTGYADYVQCFTNGEVVTFSVPAVVTNETEGAVLECRGWRCYSITNEDLAAVVTCTNAAQMMAAYAEDYCSVVAESDDANLTSATLANVASGVLVWFWELKEIYVRDVSENGYITVSVDGADATNGSQWVPACSTLEIGFETDVDGAELDYWTCDYSTGLYSETEYGVSVSAQDPRLSVGGVFGSVVENGYFAMSVLGALDGTTNVLETAFGHPTVRSPDFSEDEWQYFYNADSYDCYFASQLGGMESLHYTFSVDKYVTNVVGDVTNIYVCAGWVGTGSVPSAGTANVVNFTLCKDSSVVWLWEAYDPNVAPAALPPGYNMVGADGVAPLTVTAAGAQAKVANTVKGWWYGLYYRTNLVDGMEWKLVPNQAAQAAVDGDEIVLEALVDPSQPQKFFKLVVSSEDPR